MASEIMFDPTPMLDSNMPESSMAREPQGISINQGSLNNLLECITKMLQQISMVQMNPQRLRKEDLEPSTILSGLSVEVKLEFQDCLSSSNCDRLLKMVNKFPAQLFLQTFDEEFSRSTLHVVVLEGSRTLIRALVEKLKALPSGNDLKLVEREFILKEDKFGLSAADMVSLIANKEIISCFEQHLQVFDYREGGNKFRRSPTSEDEKKDLIEKTSLFFEKQVYTSSDKESREFSIREWLFQNNIDFAYCLHEALNCQGPTASKLESLCNREDISFLEPLFNVQNSLGRSPLHVFPSILCARLFEKVSTDFPNLDWNMLDFSGRTPLHWAAAQGNLYLVTFLASQKGINLNATYTIFKEKKMIQNTNFNIFLVEDVTPLHLAVIHNHIEVVEILLEEQGLNINAISKRENKYMESTFKWSPIQLAAYMGHEQILKVLLKDPRLYDLGLRNMKESALLGCSMTPVLHHAASQFHPLVVKALVDCTTMDTLVKDNFGDTALHYAAKHTHGRLQVHPSLFDYVTVSHFTSKPPKSRKPSDHDIITCIDILMQSGLDMEQKNNYGLAPTLHPSCPEKVQIWWLEKMVKEAQENKNNLIIAANAISVTAAVVATASFVGPLQPPLGLFDDGNQTWLDGYSQVKHTSVQVFLFCDSLSFYLAIAAIIFAMLPSWPIPHEGLAQEVRIARRCVQVAILLLFGSIKFVVCAFSAASIAIVPNQRWQYKTIVVISTSLGVLICFLILFLSFMRLLTLISSRSEVAKKISNVATQIMLWERDTSFAK